MKRRRSFRLLLGLWTSLWCCLPAVAAEFEANWKSLSHHEPAPEWFKDAKFGIYFHWGVYSVPAFANEWYPRNMYDKEGREHRHHVETYGEPTKFGYPDFVPQFKAEKFDADEWADLFVEAGARFAGPVAEHHDGFAMWASKLTPWNAKEKGPKRDITGELAQAIRKRGMKFVTTFHHARNNLYEKERRGRLEWTGHYSFVKRNFPSLLENEENAILYGYMPRPKFLTLWKGKLKEVVDLYQPDLMWFDSWLDEIPDSVKMEFLAYYFNQAQTWGKEGVVTYKQKDLPTNVGVLDLEKGRMDKKTDFWWLTDDTISLGSWCYTQDLKIKSTKRVLHSLIDIVSKNGILMLNISPKADGTIPENQRKVLVEIGQWLAKNGEALYDTRTWYILGEGPTGRGLPKGEFGGIADPKGGYTSEDIRYTQAKDGKTIYAVTLGKPQSSREIVLTSFAAAKVPAPLTVTSVTELESGEEVPFTRDERGLILRPARTPLSGLAVAFKIGLAE